MTLISVASKCRSDVFIFVVVAAIVLLSRLPFLGAGYGLDPDAWRVANTARKIATTGEYSASRLPGYPVQEITCSLIWRGGPLALNGATTLFSALAAAFLALSVKLLGGRDYLLASLALAFTPVIFINSTGSMDYLWALAFVLGSFYFVLARHPWVAGILLGVAIGCRLTSGAMLIPLGLLLLESKAKKYNVGQMLKLCVAACLIGAIAFAPVVSKYGSGFLQFREGGYNATWRNIVNIAGVQVWGGMGLHALLIAAISLALRPTLFRGASSIPQMETRHIATWIAAIGLYTVAFLRLPHEAGYLIPTIPFVILLLGRVLERRMFILFCILMLFSSLVSIGQSGIGRGPVILAHSARIGNERFTERLLSKANSLPEKSVIVVASWLPQIQASLPLEQDSMVEYVYSLDAQQIHGYVRDGFKIYYLPGIREYHLRAFGVDLQEYGAIPLDVDY